MKGLRKPFLVALALLAGALAGCSLGPQMKEPPASYDFGPVRGQAAAPVITVTLMMPEVTAPPWLDSSGIVYRLNYESAARPQVYVHSRWAAPPAQLLTQRLRGRFAAASAAGIVTGSDGARADYALRVELEDFSQSFNAANASRVTARARASLVNLASRTLVAQRLFSLEQPAPTPDARGAVAALGAAGDDLVDQLLAWTGERLKPGTK